MRSFLLVILTVLWGFSFGQTLLYNEGVTTSTKPPTGFGEGGATAYSVTTTGTGSSGSGDYYCRFNQSQTSGTYTYFYTKPFTAVSGKIYYITYKDRGTNQNVATYPGFNFNLFMTTNKNLSFGTSNINTTTSYLNGTNSSTASGGWQLQTSQQWTCPSGGDGTYWFVFRVCNTSTGGYVSLDDFTIYEITPSCSSPTVPSSLSRTIHNSSDITVSWTPGNGDRSIVFVSPSVLSSNVVDGTSYVADSRYSLGTSLGNGYCVYNGSGSSIKVLGLTRNTSYVFTVYSYNSNGGSPCYKKDVITSINGTTTSSNGMGSSSPRISHRPRWICRILQEGHHHQCSWSSR